MIIATKVLVGTAVCGLLTASVSFLQGGVGQPRADTTVAVITSSEPPGETRALQDDVTAANAQVQNQHLSSRYCPGACDWAALFRAR